MICSDSRRCNVCARSIIQSTRRKGQGVWTSERTVRLISFSGTFPRTSSARTSGVKQLVRLQQTPLQLANECSPVTLASNWVNETATFFAKHELRARLWSPEAWNADDSIEVVWIVKVSELSDGIVRNPPGRGSRHRRHNQWAHRDLV
jgi:hypothetical protein